MSYKARSTRYMKNVLHLFEDNVKREFIVVDIETTGKNPEKDYIVEFSAIRYLINERKLHIVSELNVFIKPPVQMADKVIAIHHISNEFLKDKPSEKEVFQSIFDFIGFAPVLAGYNILFDKRFIEMMYHRNGVIFSSIADFDVLEMARDLNNLEETKNFKLSSIASLYGVDEGLIFHNALDDVKATGRLMSVFYNEYKLIYDKTDFSSKEKLYINSVYFWKGFNKQQKGIYINTNLGKIWLSTVYKCWLSTEVDLSYVDIEHLESDICIRIGRKMSDLYKMTEKRFSEIKETKGGFI